jgi:hypothetical protein
MFRNSRVAIAALAVVIAGALGVLHINSQANRSEPTTNSAPTAEEVLESAIDAADEFAAKTPEELGMTLDEYSQVYQELSHNVTAASVALNEE